MATDTTEKGLENLIAESLTVGAGYVQGDPKDYDSDYAVDLVTSVALSFECPIAPPALLRKRRSHVAQDAVNARGNLLQILR